MEYNKEIEEKLLKQFEEKLETPERAYLLAMTMLGCAAQFAQYLLERKPKYEKLPLMITYAGANVAANMLALMGDADKSIILNLDLSQITDIQKKIDLITDYLIEVRTNK